MNIGMDGLKMLADRGRELNITAALARDRVARISLDNEHHFYAGANSANPERVTADLSRQLRFHPQRVRINGVEIPRVPWENLAGIETTQYRSKDGRSYSVTYSRPGIPGEMSIGPYNAIAGGTLTQRASAEEREPHTIHAPADKGGNSHWKPANGIRLRTITVIQTDELDQMDEREFQGHVGDATEQRGRARAIANRKREQVRNTLKHPDMPETHEGAVFRYLVGKPGHPLEERGKGMPIIITGQPVDMNPGTRDASDHDYVNAVEALYNSDQRMVPARLEHSRVQEGQDGRRMTLPTVTGWEFAADEPEDDTTPPPMKQVQAITARFTLIQGGRTETTEIPATMFLDKQGDRHIVRFTNAIDGPAELAEAMVRAYADSNYQDDPDGEYELQEELEGLHRQYETEIRAAMLDPQAADQAAAEWLNEEAERLDRELLTKPKAKGLTATSRSGGITISAHSPLP